jgi:hypothetical protein
MNPHDASSNPTRTPRANRFILPSNAPAQARQDSDVRLSTATRSRRCLQPV